MNAAESDALCRVVIEMQGTIPRFGNLASKGATVRDLDDIGKVLLGWISQLQMLAQHQVAFPTVPMRMPRFEPSFDKPEMALGTPTPWSSTPMPGIEGLLRKAMEARLLSTFGMSTGATFIDTDPVLESRPKQPALPAPAPPPVSSETMSEAWAQELARYNAAKLTFF
jgi:hypothetical protein